jgi:hypothetical protein
MEPNEAIDCKAGTIDCTACLVKAGSRVSPWADCTAGAETIDCKAGAEKLESNESIYCKDGAVKLELNASIGCKAGTETTQDEVD